MAQYPESSEYVTSQVLLTLGELRQIGYLPDDKFLKALIDKALVYYDKEVAKQYVRDPKGTWSRYAYIRSLFPGSPTSSAAQKALRHTVNRTVEDWKTYTPVGKAFAALTLAANGHKNVASAILQSLREYAESSKDQGMWWPASNSWSLDKNASEAVILKAFATIQPDASEIDPIRQWLILNKRLQNWGSSLNTSFCIAAILNCGSEWNHREGNAEIKIDNQLLSLNDIDRLTGAFTTTLPENSLSLTIDRTNNTPAWGATITRGNQKMTEIPAHSIPELSVEKDILVRRGASNDHNASRVDYRFVSSDSLRLGDVVEVRLTIRAERDMDYVVVTDQRAACFEPVVQTPRYVYCDGASFYLENRNSQTNLFIDRLRSGTYVITYQMTVNNAGQFASGTAVIQSYYAPEMTAHSAGSTMEVIK